MPVEKDVFGFDELKKAFDKCGKKYPNNADALLMSHGQAVQKKTKADTPVYKGKISAKSKIKPGQLQKSWRVKPPKLYQGEKYRVVRIQSAAPHAHLIEDGHEMVSGGSSYLSERTGTVISRGRNKGKQKMIRRKMNAAERSIRGVKGKGFVEGKYMLEKAMSEARSRFEHDAEKMIDDLTRDIQV